MRTHKGLAHHAGICHRPPPSPTHKELQELQRDAGQHTQKEPEQHQQLAGEPPTTLAVQNPLSWLMHQTHEPSLCTHLTATQSAAEIRPSFTTVHMLAVPTAKLFHTWQNLEAKKAAPGKFQLCNHTPLCTDANPSHPHSSHPSTNMCAHHILLTTATKPHTQ